MKSARYSLVISIFFLWCTGRGLQPNSYRLDQRRRRTILSSSSFSADTWFESRPVAARLLECSSEGYIRTDPELTPLAEQTDDEKQQLSKLVDYLHTELLKLSPDAEDLDDENADTIDDEAFADFIAEGRKLLAISKSQVAHGEDADAVADTVWTSLADLLYENDIASDRLDSGLLIAMPSYIGDVKSYVHNELLEPLALMGLGKDRIEVQSYRVAQGAPFPAFRIMYTAASS